jgi:hypothetical protein
MTRLEEDAEAFKRKSAAERKRRQRERERRGISGEVELTIQAHLPSLIRLLMTERLLAAVDGENIKAISAAASEHFRRRANSGKLIEPAAS